jgi:hypothetical protein
MQIKTVTNGVVYEMSHTFPEIGEVVIDVVYSNGEFGEFEFECSVIDIERNMRLSPEQIQSLNKELESGLEETVVQRLIDFYMESDLLFSPNDYAYLITNTNS